MINCIISGNDKRNTLKAHLICVCSMLIITLVMANIRMFNRQFHDIAD
jgi:hypothetical protein